MDNNIIVLRQDIENSWKWSQNIIEEIKEIKNKQTQILLTIKNHEETVNFIQKKILGYKIINNTNI